MSGQGQGQGQGMVCPHTIKVNTLHASDARRTCHHARRHYGSRGNPHRYDLSSVTCTLDQAETICGHSIRIAVTAIQKPCIAIPDSGQALHGQTPCAPMRTDAASASGFEFWARHHRSR